MQRHLRSISDYKNTGTRRITSSALSNTTNSSVINERNQASKYGKGQVLQLVPRRYNKKNSMEMLWNDYTDTAATTVP